MCVRARVCVSCLRMQAQPQGKREAGTQRMLAPRVVCVLRSKVCESKLQLETYVLVCV